MPLMSPGVPVVSLVVLAAILSLGNAQAECPRNDTAVADTGRCTYGAPCNTMSDCRGTRECHCDGICGMMCIKAARVEYCAAIPASLNVTLVYEDPYKFESGVNATCSEGYQYESGDAVRKCQGDYNWSGDQYRCSLITCGTPPPVELAHVSPEDVRDVYLPGEWIFYSCDYGHYRDGSNAILCLDTLEWTVPNFECRPKSCPPPRIDNGYVVGTNFQFGSTVEVYCDEGYELTGLRYMTCDGESNWSGYTRRCDIVECPALSAPPNGIKTGRTYTYGEEVRFKCNEGYIVEGSEVRECQADGTWSGDVTSCTEINCGEPKADYSPNFPHITTLVGGNTIGDTFGYQDVVYYRCDAGHRIDGRESAHCTQQQTWSAPVPKCNEYVKPQIESPDSVAPVNTDPGQPTARVNFTMPSATDNSGHVLVTSSHDPGTRFRIGDTNVIFTAIDISGNTAVMQMPITVLDKEEPVFTSRPSNMIVPNTPGQATAVVDLPTPMASDNSGYVTVTSNHVSKYFKIGETTVMYTASDESGNSVTARMVVSVIDNEPPAFGHPPVLVDPPLVIDPLNNIKAVVDYGKKTKHVTWALNATDNSGKLNVSCSTSSGFVIPSGVVGVHSFSHSFDIGLERVTCTISDATGKTAKHSFNITVEEPPTTTTTSAPSTEPTTALVRTEPTDKTVFTFLSNSADIYCYKSKQHIEVAVIRGGNLQSEQVCFQPVNKKTTRKLHLDCRVKRCLTFMPSQRNSSINIDVSDCIRWVEDVFNKDHKRIGEFFEGIHIKFNETNSEKEVYGSAMQITYVKDSCTEKPPPSLPWWLWILIVLLAACTILGSLVICWKYRDILKTIIMKPKDKENKPAEEDQPLNGVDNSEKGIYFKHPPANETSGANLPNTVEAKHVSEV